MLTARNKRKTADARSRQLRRRLYRGAAIATLVYVVLSIVNFLLQLPALPYELAVIWAVVIVCYATFREALRWNNLDDTNYPGEFLAALVVMGGTFMIAWNIGREWLFHLPNIVFPQDYQAAVIETIVLYTLSGISSFVYARKQTSGRRHRIHLRLLREKQKALALKVSPAIAPVMPNSEIKATLTSAPPHNDKDPSAPKNS